MECAFAGGNNYVNGEEIQKEALRERNFCYPFRRGGVILFRKGSLEGKRYIFDRGLGGDPGAWEGGD